MLVDQRFFVLGDQQFLLLVDQKFLVLVEQALKKGEQIFILKRLGVKVMFEDHIGNN